MLASPPPQQAAILDQLYAQASSVFPHLLSKAMDLASASNGTLHGKNIDVMPKELYSVSYTALFAC